LERIAATGRKGTATQGGAVPMSANEGRRAARANPLYNQAEADRVVLTPELEALIAGREAQPAVVRGNRAFRQQQTNAEVAGQPIPRGPVAAVQPEAEVRDSMGMLVSPATPGSPGHRSVQDLQRVKDEMTAEINRIRITDPDRAYRLGVARSQLNEQMSAQSPNFAQATNLYRQFSQPQNQSDVAEVLVNALRGANGKERATSFLNARQNAPQTIKKAGVPRFEQIEQVMTPTQMRQINAVTNSLRRQTAYENIGRSEIPGVKAGAQVAEEAIPSLIDRTMSFAKKGLRQIGIKGDVEINKIIDEATLHPERMAQLLERVTPSDQIKILSAVRQANPKGASIGLVAGQE